MAETTTYTGGCHCGAVRYRVKVKLDRAMICNCSICTKAGTMLAFTPVSELELLAGQDALSDYQWGKKRIHHLFCRHCGIRSFAGAIGPDGREMAAINVRCLDGVDLGAVPTGQFDGKSMPVD